MKCPFCGREFRYVSHFVRHVRTVHLYELVACERSGWCPICRADVANLHDHILFMMKFENDYDHAALYIAMYNTNSHNRRLAAEIIRNGRPTTSSIIVVRCRRGSGWRSEALRITLDTSQRR